MVLVSALEEVKSREKIAAIIQNDPTGGTSVLLEDWTKLNINLEKNPFKIYIMKQNVFPEETEKVIWIQWKK